MKNELWVFLLSMPFSYCQAQSSAVKSNWRLDHPFEQKVFIENNEGQFDGKIDSGKVLFSTSIDGLSLFFTSNGVTYRYDEFSKIDQKERNGTEHNMDKEDIPKPVTHFFSAKWEGVNINTEIIAENEVNFYYCYTLNCKHTTITHAFKKLLYKNLYPGIDVEYKFPTEKKGIEYSVIVHPRADISKAKLLYKDAKSIKQNQNGDIEIDCSFGEFIDHAPEKTWYKETNENIFSSFSLSGNEILFSVGNYDKSKTLIIDPWITDPGFSGYDAAYNLDYDNHGNVYVYGGGSSSIPYQLIKLNNAGTIQWIFNSLSFYFFNWGYGAFTVDKISGTCFTGEGWNQGIVRKINTQGILLDSIYFNEYMQEIWRMKYDMCLGKIIVGGGGTLDSNQVTILDTNLQAPTLINALGTSHPYHDVALLTLDNYSGYCFMAFSKNYQVDTLEFDNVLLKCPIPNLIPTSFMVLDGYKFREGASNAFVWNKAANGINGMVCTYDWLYLYDGSTLTRFDKNTGNLITALNINSPVYNKGAIQVYWSGLDADICGNIYLGNVNKIDVYDSGLNKINTIPMTATSDTIYDLQIGANNMLYVCGKGFVSSYSIPIYSIIKKTSPACSGCNGTALVYLNGCNNNIAKFNWSNGATTQFLTGLCSGTYSVTATAGCETLFSDTVFVQSSPAPSVNIPTATLIDVSCFNGSDGSATAIASGGTSPYNYLWFPPDNTNQTIDNLIAGNYTVITTDSNGCANIDSATIPQPSLLTMVTSLDISIYQGQTAILTATEQGGTPSYTYSWNGSNGGSSLIVSPNFTTSYTITITDNNGCESSKIINVEVLCGEVYIPDAFSPNSDGHNDVLYVRGNCIETMDFLVFDRWGNKIFESNSINKGWDGSYKGQPMNLGTYVWFLKATLQDGKSFEKKGNVTLVR